MGFAFALGQDRSDKRFAGVVLMSFEHELSLDRGDIIHPPRITLSEPKPLRKSPEIADRIPTSSCDPIGKRTPRVSLIVVLPENHVLSTASLTRRLSAYSGRQVDVVVACAGQPTNLSALQRNVGDAQFVLAPAGTNAEDLRELAMREVSGDIVTLLAGVAVPVSISDEQERSMTS